MPSSASTSDPVRVIVVDDHQMFAESVARLLGAEDDIEVVGVAGTVDESARLAAATAPDVAIVDLQLPDGDGIDAARSIHEVNPAVRIVVLTGAADDKLLMSAIENGCSGFVTKDKALRELVEAVRLAARGETYIAPSMLTTLLPRLRSGHRRLGSDLTRREREVLNLIADGLSNQAIAAELFLSVHTVRNHIQALLVKLDAHSKLAAASVAAREGLLERRR